MIGNGTAKDSLTSVDHAIAGAISGFVTRFICQPFDVVKIRFQLQLEPIKSSHPTAKYTSILHGTLCIFREEGITAFWKGHVPAQMLSVVYGGVQFSSYEYLLKRCDSTLGREAVVRWSNTVHFACGFTSGCLSTAVAHPFDVIRTRLVAQLEPKTYPSISQAVRLMWRQEGPRSFYRGMLPTLLQIGPLSGFQFGFYHFFTHLWTLLLEDDANVTGIRKSVACGALSGIVSKTLVYPLDLIKKRLQVQGFRAEGLNFGRYNGFLHCVRCIFVQEGFLGYFKGYLPSVLKAMATTSSYFASYEAACEMLKYRHS
uniref:Mitochondrial thiamine pyrophosphate carrier n=1 Tax=Ixodes ricinus TaxID=34613 RepID=A0A131Y9C8_IXORI